MFDARLIPTMSFFIGRAAIAFPMSKRRAHLRGKATAKYVLPVLRNSNSPLNARDGVMARFRSDAVFAAHDRYWLIALFGQVMNDGRGRPATHFRSWPLTEHFAKTA